MTDDKITAPTLKEWYINEADVDYLPLTDKQFYELLECLSFELKHEVLKNDMKIYYLKDLQEGNIQHIEQDIFYTEWEHDNNQDVLSENIKEQVVDRLDTVYLHDYFVINNAFDDD